MDLALVLISFVCALCATFNFGYRLGKEHGSSSSKLNEQCKDAD